jgi:uncharacterized protein (DUF2252 family)
MGVAAPRDAITMTQPTPMQANPNAPADVGEAVKAFNAGRDPERLAMKYAKMAQSPALFLRGGCHLFYDSLPDAPTLRDAPLAWCCGDLHFENYGSYKGDNRQVCFDINDYDEAALAPATWDMVRLLASIQCGADDLRATRDEALAASKSCLEAYRTALMAGKPLSVEPQTATGLVATLLNGLHARKRTDFLDKRTVRKGGRRHLLVDGVKAQPVADATRQKLLDFMQAFARAQPDPTFFTVLDIAVRIAGTGSLGVARYVVLVEGKGSPDGNYLLDIKEAKPSSLLPHLTRIGVKQPAWRDEAERVVTVQQRMQAINLAFLQAVKFDGGPYLLRGLQPSEDRVAISDWGKKQQRLDEVVMTMGRILAWDQLRAAGRSGSADADQLIAFAQGEHWVAEMMDGAEHMAALTRAQWKNFRDRRQKGVE